MRRPSSHLFRFFSSSCCDNGADALCLCRVLGYSSRKMSKRVGLMGCGQVAGYGHIPAILATPDLELFAIFEPDPDRAREIQHRFGIPFAFSRTEDFFASGIEAVTITSPAPCHRENVIDCARHHLPVLCEKPLAINKAEGDEMVAAMRDADQSFYAGFCYRFSPPP